MPSTESILTLLALAAIVWGASDWFGKKAAPASDAPADKDVVVQTHFVDDAGVEELRKNYAHVFTSADAVVAFLRSLSPGFSERSPAAEHEIRQSVMKCPPGYRPVFLVVPK